MHELNAIITIAFRDFTKLIRDRLRLAATFVFPVIFIGVLGGGLNASFGDRLGFDFLSFVFAGVLAQTMFQSAAAGVISLIRDRETDFSKELFVAPVSRHGVIFGKILGEALVALVQGVGIIVFGLIIGVSLDVSLIARMAPVIFGAALLGGSFGILILGNIREQRTATQIFPFVIFPQMFLAGVFNPINDFPPFFRLLSSVIPMRYPVDLLRGIYYGASEEASRAVASGVLFNLSIMALMFVVFLVLGTYFFVRNERNR